MRHDTVRRAVRTFAQAFLAALLLLLPTDLVLDASLYVEVGTAAAYSALVALVTFAHNELEDAGRVRDTREPRSGS